MKKFYLLAVFILLTGCGSSSPRFGAIEAKTKTHHLRKAPQHASAITEEEREQAAEDDVKVDAAQVLSKVNASSHSPRKKTKRASGAKVKTPAAGHASLEPSEEADAQSASTLADTASEGSIDQQRMMETIAQWLETPYEYGSDGVEEGIDCSAFTREVFEEATDITLPRSSAEQSQFGKRVSRNELKFGDLVFFKTRGRRISHVGIYIGDDLFAHASSGSGVTISSLDSTYFNKRYAAARRVLK
jgi:murein DD-endopeptidase / murein LD-carboxypeptidase